MDIQVRTKVIKRNGEEVDFHLEKIINAIKAANKEVDKIHQMSERGGYPGHGGDRHHGDAGIRSCPEIRALPL